MKVLYKTEKQTGSHKSFFLFVKMAEKLGGISIHNYFQEYINNMLVSLLKPPWQGSCNEE